MSMLTRVGNRLEKAIHAFELFLNYVSVLMLSIMVLLGTADVIARYVFNHPIRGSLELQSILMAGAVFLIIGYVQAEKSNITLDMVINRYHGRTRIVADIVVLMFTFCLFVLIAWQSFSLALKDREYGRLIENVYLPVYPFELLLTFGAVMVCLECLVQLARTIARREARREVSQ
jgi:TRAP-type C4-dicarboxylate transport system permease small subunit